MPTSPTPHLYFLLQSGSPCQEHVRLLCTMRAGDRFTFISLGNFGIAHNGSVLQNTTHPWGDTPQRVISVQNTRSKKGWSEAGGKSSSLQHSECWSFSLSTCKSPVSEMASNWTTNAPNPLQSFDFCPHHKPLSVTFRWKKNLSKKPRDTVMIALPLR